MKNQRVFPYKVKEGSYAELLNIIRFPAVTGPEIDGQVCRVTISDYAIDLSLKGEYVHQYKDDSVFKVRLLYNDEREFIVLGSMLVHLDTPVVVCK